MRFAAIANALFGAAVASALAGPAGVLPWDAADGGFEQARAPHEFVFPRDHGPHPSFAHEWWYLTGHLQDASGARFGFELTFFRLGLEGAAAPPAPGASHWRTRQMLVAHFALTDIDRQQFHSAERYARAALALAGAQADPLRVWLDDWSLELSGSRWQLQARQPGYALELALTPAHAPVLNGAAGLSQKSGNPADASYYYSIPRLTVEGRLTRAAEPLALRGTAWLDREWGSGGLSADEAGWDWFALQLNDGSALMFYALRRRDGDTRSSQRRHLGGAGRRAAAAGEPGCQDQRARELAKPARRPLPGALAPGGCLDRPGGGSAARGGGPGARGAAALLGGCCGGQRIARPAAHRRRGLCGARGLCSPVRLAAQGHQQSLRLVVAYARQLSSFRVPEGHRAPYSARVASHHNPGISKQ